MIEGAFMLDKNNIILGIAPIGWTNDADSKLGGDITFEQCVSEMALAGFQGCEVGIRFPRDTALLKRKLDIRGLRVVNCWTSLKINELGLDWSENEFRKNAQFLKEMGAKVIGVCDCSFRPALGGDYTPNGRYIMDDAQWDILCQGLNKLGKIGIEEYGVKLCYHHHAGTSIETEAEVDRLMENTDPRYVHLLFDTGHLEVLGFDPAVTAKKHISRIGHVHLKAVRKSIAQKCKDEVIPLRHSIPMGIYTVPGDGDSDFTKVFQILDEANYTGCILVEAEQDPNISNPFEMAVLTRNYIRQISGL